MIDHILGTVIYNMVILLEVNKTTFEKGESLEKNQKSENLAKI